jgi:hypothetical protein
MIQKLLALLFSAPNKNFVEARETLPFSHRGP